MAEVDDGYDTYYAERLWQLLPAVYRTADTDSFVTPGPLRELLNRIGARWPWSGAASTGCGRTSRSRPATTGSSPTSATCSARTSSPTSTRGQRLDVAKTIHYRRRKGTLEVLEEIALDVTGLDRVRRRGLPAAGPYPARPRPGRRAGRLPAGEPGRGSPAAAAPRA